MHEEGVLVSERLVETALLNAGRFDQIRHRRRLVAVEPKGVHCGLERVVDLELSRASSGCHGQVLPLNGIYD